MGQMRFLVSPPSSITEDLLQQAYMSGIDRTPWPVRISAEGDLTAARTRRVGFGQCPRPLVGRGARPADPLHRLADRAGRALPAARGVGPGDHQPASQPVVRVAGDRAGGAGGRDDKFKQPRRSVYRWAAVRRRTSRKRRGTAKMRCGWPWTPRQLLAAAYAEQAIASPPPRRRENCRRCWAATWPGPTLDDADGAAVPGRLQRRRGAHLLARRGGQRGRVLLDRLRPRVEWCRAQGLKVCTGPLVQLDARGLPDWALSLGRRFRQPAGRGAGEFVEAAVSRYRGKVDLWQCAGRSTRPRLLALSEEENLQLAACIASAWCNRSIPRRRTWSRIDQPWGEYMGRRDCRLSPAALRRRPGPGRHRSQGPGAGDEPGLLAAAARCREPPWNSAANWTLEPAGPAAAGSR